MKEHPYAPDSMIPRDKAAACFVADKLQQPLSLRLCRQGDSFVPVSYTHLGVYKRQVLMTLYP